MRRYFILDRYNTWYDWRLTLTAKELPDPEPKTHYVALDGAHGSLDFTEALTGETVYSDRTVKATFMTSEGTYQEREAVLREISAALHGRKVKIVEPDDPEHYFMGRVKVVQGEKNHAYATLTIEATCEPWRYAMEETERRVVVDGAAAVVIHNNGKRTLCPTISVTGTVLVTYDGTTVELTRGVYLMTNIKLRQGVNLIGVNGKGTVTFTYREAGL